MSTESDVPPLTPLRPFAVKIPTALILLGDKSRSHLYELAGQGLLDLIKDGRITLVTTASIDRYMAARPPAKVTAYRPRKRQAQGA